jgi:hypothetical protein
MNERAWSVVGRLDEWTELAYLVVLPAIAVSDSVLWKEGASV